MKQNHRSTALLLALAGLSAPSMAQDNSTVSVSGFGSAALTASDTDQAEFIRPYQAQGVKKHPRTGADSSLGLQVNAGVNAWLSLTGQGMVLKHLRDNYDAELRLAFAKAQVADELSVRVGRIGLPAYITSEYRSVGYANTMMRPPIELYNQQPFDYVDGVDAICQHGFGDTTLTAQVGAGRSKFNFGGLKFQLHSVAILNIIAEHGPFTLRFGHLAATASVTGPELDGLTGALQQAGYGADAESLRFRRKTARFTAAGFNVDWENIIAQTEYARRGIAARLVPDTTSWYAMLGYRIGRFTPYVNHAVTRQDNERGFSDLPTGGPLAPLSAVASQLTMAGLQTTDSLGLRWDFRRAAAFKVQWDRIRPRDGAGLFANPQPGFAGPVNVYAAGIDFVF